MNSTSENIDPVDVELDALISLFFDEAGQVGEFQDVAANEIPSPFRELLAHDRHMTVTVERHHQSPVDVHVVSTRSTDESYSRNSLLVRQSDGKIVQFGIVRLNFDFFSDAVRREVERQQVPLGRVLIQHDVMRQVRLLNLYRVVAGPILARAMGIEPGSECYGRTAMIFCNGAAAIELLEIVGNC